MVREVPIRPKPHVNKLQASFAFHPVAIAIYPITITGAPTIAMQIFAAAAIAGASQDWGRFARDNSLTPA